MVDATTLWKANERRFVDAILNQMVPASSDGRIPAAGDLGIGDFIADRVVPNPFLQNLFADGLTKAAEIGASDTEAVRQIEAELPEFFAVLQRLTYMGYYSRPDIRAVFGLSPKPVHPDGYDVPTEPEDLMADLTAPVRDRGKCHRDV